MADTVHLIGLKEANAALRKLPEFCRSRVQREMDVTAFNVARDANSRVRRRTGLLSRSLRWESRPRSLSAIVGIAFEAFYWKFLEYGTVKMPAQPFLRPAAEANRSDHDSRLIRALNDAANDVEAASGSRLL